MIRIAFNLGGPTFVAFDQQSDSVAHERHHRRKKQRLAQYHAVGLLHIRHDVRLLVRFATCESGECQRSGHQLQEIPAIDRVVPLRRLPWKFPVQQLLKMRIIRQFIQRSPILFAAL